MLSTLMMTVFVDLITAVVVGFVMASVLFVVSMAESQLNNARFIQSGDSLSGFSPDEQKVMISLGNTFVLFHMEGPLSFGSARDIAKLIQSAIKKMF